ncbi:MAG: NAD-dependent epimerase/dehydratase family protein [Acidobacteria bacterium]|nr:NAD-dependent epimerase/dehydratase family protein [Acidobacteriota bacterium]
MTEKNYLITGAHGFIGAWVVKRLLAANAGQVVMFDRSADPRRLRLIMDEDEIERTSFVAGDITAANTLPPIVEQHGITHIIHLAGLQVPSCKADPRMGAMVNVIGTINVFEAALHSAGQVKHIAYASSAAVFGKSDDTPQTEDKAGNTGSHYGAFKRCNEDNARIYFLDNGISSIGLRPLTVYGVGRDFGVTSDPTKAMKAAVVGRPFHIRFGGRTDFLYAADCADAFIRSADSEQEGAFVFNLHGETAAIADIIAEIETEVPAAKGTITQAENIMPIPAELDDSAIIATLGDIPHTSLRQGVQETIARFKVLHEQGRLDTADLDV